MHSTCCTCTMRFFCQENEERSVLLPWYHTRTKYKNSDNLKTRKVYFYIINRMTTMTTSEIVVDPSYHHNHNNDDHYYHYQQIYLTLHFVIDQLLTPIYLLLTFAALLSLISPILRDLSTHGKTRSSSSSNGGGDDDNDQSSTKSSVRWWFRYLRKNWQNLSIIPKRRFVDFYVSFFGMLMLMIMK